MATSRDADVTGGVLARAGIDAFPCADTTQLIGELARGAGALLLAEEAVPLADRAALAAVLDDQPPWSDLAVLMLARAGADSAGIAWAMEQLPNLTVIERPVRVASLVSAVRSALRARQRQYEVRALLEDLRRADQRKTEFLATLAHELRNPLAPIRTTLALLSGPALDPAATHRYHERMRRQVDHMVRLVNDLMEVSRITRGKVDLQFVLVSLDAVIGDAIDLSRPLLDAAGHTLDVEIDTDALLVSGDAVRLTQVFSNLLNNAAKYTPPGGRISVTARRDGEDAVVEVSDSGVGLAPDSLTPIFEMFVQVGDTAKAAQGGLGIGLTLVKSLVELHGGSVSAASPGLHGGATFTVRLPLAADAARARRSASDPAGWSSAAVSRTVLVVDDNRDAADSLADLLRSMGATVVTAYRGEQALRHAGSMPIGIAILDIGMPGMDGYHLARCLRAQPGGETMTLIALTGWGEDMESERFSAAGFDHHLLKPVDEGQLAALIQAGAVNARSST